MKAGWSTAGSEGSAGGRKILAFNRPRSSVIRADQRYSTDLYVRGELPMEIGGRFIVAMNRRHKDRARFSRWHDSQADLLRLEVVPGHPGSVKATILEVDPSGRDLGRHFHRSAFEVEAFGANSAYGYATQPNHGINAAGSRIWATNLLFGAPLEDDLDSWSPTRILRYVTPNPDSPRVSTTAHFAWSKDKKRAYFHQSLLTLERGGEPVRAVEGILTRIGASRHACFTLAGLRYL